MSVFREGRGVIFALGVGILTVPMIAGPVAFAKTPDAGTVSNALLSTAAVSTNLKLGRRGDAVRSLQRQLKKYGYLSGRVDGVFGPQTRRAVMNFQRHHGLLVDGVVGPQTRKAFLKPKRISKQQLRRLSARNRAAGSGLRFGKGHKGRLMRVLNRVKPKGLPLSLAAAVVTVESNWRVNARGASGERGLMQLMPATARNFGARGNLFNPTTNLRVGTRYLHYCYKRARRNIAATIGCYNRGPGRMWQWSSNPITRKYVARVRRMVGRRV